MSKAPDPYSESDSDDNKAPNPDTNLSSDDWQGTEDEIANVMEGFVQPASGGLYFMKGDVKSKEFLFEVKSTRNEKRYISIDVFEKIYNESKKENRYPAFVMYYLDSDEFYTFCPERYMDEFQEKIESINFPSYSTELVVDNDGKTFKNSDMSNFEKGDSICFNRLESPIPKKWTYSSISFLKKVDHSL
jgi:hypothetical protein